MVGLIPLFAVEVLDDVTIASLPSFSRRLNWFLANRSELAGQITYMQSGSSEGEVKRLLAIPSRERLERVLAYLLDEDEFLSPAGIRSVSRVHRDQPYVLEANGSSYTVAYDPGEATVRLFGGNSNWRGPVWFPLNFLIVEALERYHHFYGDSLLVEFPTGSGHRVNLRTVARALAARLTRPFLADTSGHRPVHAGEQRYARDPAWKDLVLFYEYFHGDTARGVGASHQTGWTALAAQLIADVVNARVGTDAHSPVPRSRSAAVPPITTPES